MENMRVTSIFVDEAMGSNETHRVTRKFLDDLVEAFCAKNNRYFEAWKAEKEGIANVPCFPILCEENQMSSIFSAAINQVSPIHLSEKKVKSAREKNSKEPKSGNADFYVRYQGIDISLELKRKHENEKDVQQRWNFVCYQAKRHVVNSTCERTVGVGLMVVLTEPTKDKNATYDKLVGRLNQPLKEIKIHLKKEKDEEHRQEKPIMAWQVCLPGQREDANGKRFDELFIVACVFP